MTRLDYCQFLLASQINYTLTYFADHARKWSHDTINRYLRGDQVTPRLIWENVQDGLVPHPCGYLLFDDTVLDKRYSREIEPARRQWSGNAKGVIEGIGVVTCVYVNPDLDRFWIIDYRIYAPETDGKTKLRHVREMLTHTVTHKRLTFQTVLMDTWYATMPIWKQIEQLGKIYYCPVRINRQVSLAPGEGYQRVDGLRWSTEQAVGGRLVHLKKMPKGHRVKLFRLALSSERTEYVVTNDVAQSSAEAARDECGVRWKIEQLHREVKQTTGIARCQCRTERIQRNHIGCALLVWVRLKAVAHDLSTTVYALKRDLLSDYMVQQLQTPSIKMTLA
ncbi:MAG: IS701 family transposase [Rhodothermales bacterium]